MKLDLSGWEPLPDDRPGSATRQGFGLDLTGFEPFVPSNSSEGGLDLTGFELIENSTTAEDLADLGRNLREIPKGIPGAAIGLVGTSMVGMGTINAGANQTRQNRLKAMVEKIEGYPELDESGRAELRRELADPLTRVEGKFELGQMLEAIDRGEQPQLPDFVSRTLGKDFAVREDPIFGVGKDVVDFGRSILPATPGFEQSMGRQVGEGLGSVAAGVVTSLVATPVGAGALFAFAGAGEAAERAIQAGATDEQMIEAANLGLFPGFTDSIPIETLMGRIPIPGIGRIQLPEGTLGRVIGVVGKMGYQAFVEGVQEGGQQFLQNLIAREVYAPDQSLTEEVKENAFLGAIIGAGAKGIGLGGQALVMRATDRSDKDSPEGIPEGAIPAEEIIGSVEQQPLESSPTSAGGPPALAPQPLDVMSGAVAVDPLSPGDLASPIPNEIIQRGREVLAAAKARMENAGLDDLTSPVPGSEVIASAEAAGEATKLLEAEGLPGVGTRVSGAQTVQQEPAEAVPSATGVGTTQDIQAAPEVAETPATPVVLPPIVEGTSETVSPTAVSAPQAPAPAPTQLDTSGLEQVQPGPGATSTLAEGVQADGSQKSPVAVATAHHLDVARNPVAGPTKARARAEKVSQSTGFMDVATFLAKKGGIRDDEGHHLRKGRDLQQLIPRTGPLIRKAGMGIDAAGEALWEAGFFGEGRGRPTEAEVLDLLERTSGRQKVYAPSEQVDASEVVKNAQIQQENADFEAEVLALSSELGEKFSQAEIDEVISLMSDQQLDVESAVEALVERLAIQASDRIEEVAPNAEITEAPFFDESQKPDGAATGRGGETPAGQGNIETASQESGTPSQKTGEPAVDVTPEGVQTVVPGAEQISSKELAERRTEGRKTTTKAQKPADDGLFDVAGRGQTDAFDGSAKPRDAKDRQEQNLLPPPGATEVKPKTSESETAKVSAFLLERRLQALGLSDKVSVALVEALETGSGTKALGRYTKRLIEVSQSARDGVYVLNHEVIHALRDMGLFSEKEWKILERAAQSNKSLMAEMRKLYGEQGLTEEQITEEAVAEMYAAWAKRKAGQSVIGRLFARVKSFFNAIRDFTSGQSPSSESVLQSIESGEVGSRPVPSDAVLDADFEEAAARFMIKSAAPSSEEISSASQGLIAQGQPLDRALRLPFAIFGGVNKEGSWNWGEGLYKGAERAIVEAKFNPKGRMAWLNGPLEAARVGLIDRYGLSEEYITLERGRERNKRRILMDGEEILKTLKDQNIQVEEAKVLQAVLTGEAVADADMAKLAVPIRQAIDQLGQEAVSLGLVSAESYERNRGTYLHRVYEKHEADQDGLSRMVGRMAGSRRKHIMGTHLKGRGIFLDVSAKELLASDPDFAMAKRGLVAVGERFTVLDNMSDQAELLPTKGKLTPKVLDRVYWPADRDIPKKYSSWKTSGTWEVRGRKGDRMTLWRDYTKPERAQMGEILDARYTIGKTYMLMAHDLATGRFYKDIAENETWSRSDEPDGETWADAADWSRLNTAKGNRFAWIRVPETTIPNTGKKLRWGALSGRFVRQEIWRDLNEVDTMMRPNVWRALLTQWKLNKTARNPVVHMNNVASNFIFMDMADIRLQDLQSGLRSFIKKDRHYQEALEHGAFGSDMMSQEIRDNVLQPILDDLSSTMQKPKPDDFETTASFLSRMGYAIWKPLKRLDQKSINLYRVEDEIFRMATYMRRKDFGDTPAQAANFARQQFLDYDIRAPWVNMARHTVLPFISYSYRAVPLVAKAIATRPWKLAKYFTVAYAINALAYMWDDEADEERERASLRSEERGYTWIGVPRMVRMPFRDSHGLPVFLDVRRWIPAGDIFDMNQGQGAIPIPAPLQFGGPMMLAAELALNKQAFTGQPITNELTDDWWDKTQNLSNWAWKSWMPSAAWVPGSWYWQKIDKAMGGGTDSQGRPYSVPLAISSSFGIKLKPQDVEDGLGWRAYGFREVERELRSAAARLDRRRSRNLISEKEFNDEFDRILDKLETLRTSLGQLDRAAAGQARTQQEVQ